MNYFTKEELEMLLHNIVVPEEPELREKAKDLYWRISDMIETYCDHEWINAEQEQSYYECKKCGDETL